MAAQTVIDYGARFARLMEFDGSGRKLRVLAVTEAELVEPPEAEPGQDPASIEDGRPEALRAAIDEADIAREPCAACFDAAHAAFREFDLPFTSKEQIDKVVRFEAEGHFPGDIDDYVVQHLVLRQTRDKSRLLAAAFDKDELLDRLDILQEAGLDPILVDLDAMSLHNALVQTGALSGLERSVCVDAGAVATTLLFLAGNELYSVRSMRIGAGDALSGADSEDVATARVHEFVARLTREIRRTLSTLPDFGAPQAVLLSGTGTRLPGVAEALAEVFGAEARDVDWLSLVDHKLDEEDAERFGPDLGALIGTAFRFGGLEAGSFDFRREEAAYTRKFDQVKTPLIVLSFLGFLVVAFLGLRSWMEADKLRNEYRIMSDLGIQYVQKIVTDSEPAVAAIRKVEPGPKRVQAVLEVIRDQKEDIAQKLGRSQKIPDLPSALAVWIELFDTFSRNEDPIGRFALERVDIDIKGKNPVAKISGEVEDATHYQTLIDTLKGRPMITDVEPGATKQTSTGLRFTDLTLSLDLSVVEAST